MLEKRKDTELERLLANFNKHFRPVGPVVDVDAVMDELRAVDELWFIDDWAAAGINPARIAEADKGCWQ